jgi:ligand-binding sensor domain-containing protein/DNA-binding CsgD family transcriptional regulator
MAGRGKEMLVIVSGRRSVPAGWLLLALACSCLSAEVIRYSPYRFANLNQRNGLSSGTVRCILQDRSGFIWLGTSAGLNRYDGYSFVVIHPQDGQGRSQPARPIYAMCLDDEGCIWMAVPVNGLYRYDPRNGRFLFFGPLAVAGGNRMTTQPRNLLCDHTGSIWIGSSDIGLLKLEGADRRRGDFRFRRIHLEPAGSEEPGLRSINALAEDSQGMIWAGTDEGLYALRRDGAVARSFRHHAGEAGGLPNDGVISLHADGRGSLWVGTMDGGLSRLDREPGRLITYFPAEGPHAAGGRGGYIESMAHDADGMLWLGTEGGLNRFDPGSGRFSFFRHSDIDPTSLPINHIQSVYADGAGAIWVGTLGRGICRFDPREPPFVRLHVNPDSGAEYPSFAVRFDRLGRLWFSAEQGIVTRYDWRSGETRSYRLGAAQPERAVVDDQVWALAEDSRGTIWAGTRYNGLYALDPGGMSFRPIPDSGDGFPIMSIKEDRQNTLWVGFFGRGLFRLDRRRQQLVSCALPVDGVDAFANSPMALLASRSDALWVGTNGAGLLRYDPSTGRTQRFRHHPDRPSSLACDAITCLFEDRAGRLWVGSLAGLDQLDPASGGCVHFTVREGLCNDSIMSIEEDAAGFLWIGTKAGLSRLDPQTGVCRNFHESDGLSDEEFSQGAHSGGAERMLVFSGSNGLTLFAPEWIRAAPSVPPLVLTRLTRYARRRTAVEDLASLRSLELGYREPFSLAFAALSYADSRRNRYGFALSDVTRGWVDLGEGHELTFAGLEPGRYELRIRGAGSDGIWSEPGIRLAIRVRPPFWRSHWFYALVAALVLALSFIWHRQRMRRLARRLRNQSALERFMAKRDVSRREREVIRLLLQGKSSRDIENELFISLHTVRSHIYRIYKKLGIKNRTQLVNMFLLAQMDDGGDRPPDAGGR